MIGLFGGHREGDETFLECVVREINEEISYCVTPEHFLHLAGHKGGDPEVNNCTIHSDFFIARDLPLEDLIITEGTLLIANRNGLAVMVPQFVPGFRFA